MNRLNETESAGFHSISEELISRLFRGLNSCRFASRSNRHVRSLIVGKASVEECEIVY